MKKLEDYELEQLSRGNCHIDCDFRELHGSGQGVLLRLSDIGLTEEMVFGKRARIQIQIKLTQFEEPELPSEFGSTIDQFIDSKLRFTTCLIRENQVLHGDANDCEFKLLNEMK